MEKEKHFINRANWLRAAVLGANDGILSTSSIVIGVAAATTVRETIVLSAVAGLVAGACSMAAGEFVSVSSQTDVECADLERERLALETNPEGELDELTEIYKQRGLAPSLARTVAVALMEYDALGAHARDELGIHDMTKPYPFQAAFASAAAFIFGGILPLLVSIFAQVEDMIICQYTFAILFLTCSGLIAAYLGGANILRAVGRICFWGTVAMAVSAFVGYLFGVHIG
ncbi:MAG: VIT family protein [Tannerellaceae bacterium]|nr:VIT family protein [Tannerellaceae bacterium]MCD8265045.1 VIT family protein [Tannerellaceae bacterium]